MNNWKVLVMLYLTFESQPLFASCLDEAAIFANKVCGDINRYGDSATVEADGNLSVNAAGLLKKAIGEVGGNLSGKLNSQTYANVLQKDLPNELFDVRRCKEKMAEAAINEACRTASNDPAKLAVKNKGCYEIHRKDICIGITRVFFKSKYQDKTLDWVNTGNGLTVEVNGPLHGLNGLYKFIFINNKLSSVEFGAEETFKTIENFEGWNTVGGGRMFLDRASDPRISGSKARAEEICDGSRRIISKLNDELSISGEPVTLDNDGPGATRCNSYTTSCDWHTRRHLETKSKYNFDDSGILELEFFHRNYELTSTGYTKYREHTFTCSLKLQYHSI